jgi:3-isopropylmalate dehydrogenase
MLTLCGKTFRAEFAFALWERTFYEMAKEYPPTRPITTMLCHTCGCQEPRMVRRDVTDYIWRTSSPTGARGSGRYCIAAGGKSIPKAFSMFEPIGGWPPSITARTSSTHWPLFARACVQIIGRNGRQAIEQAVVPLSQGQIKSMAAVKWAWALPSRRLGR